MWTCAIVNARRTLGDGEEGYRFRPTSVKPEASTSPRRDCRFLIRLLTHTSTRKAVAVRIAQGFKIVRIASATPTTPPTRAYESNLDAQGLLSKRNVTRNRRTNRSKYSNAIRHCP